MGPRDKDEEEDRYHVTSDGRYHESWQEAVTAEAGIEEAEGGGECRDDSVLDTDGSDSDSGDDSNDDQ
ncbi:hypothetical protein L6258_00715 [Candidatus Parcubacteria bacterium]|nr:hypothetical protein [Candidatus Parcubacteria bacterium]